MADFARFNIKVDGTAIEADIQDDLLTILVDNNWHLPDMMVLELFDELDSKSSKMKWADDTRFDLGATLEVNIDKKTVFKGEITALEPDFGRTGEALFIIRGYDKSHRLHRGRKTRTFLNMKDSAIVKKVVSGAGLSAAVDTTPATHEYVMQHNQTDMEFILARARRNGYHVYYADEKLNFKKGEFVVSGATPDLTWRDNLRSFQPRWAGAHQVDKFTVYGWDSKAKQEIKAEISPNGKLKQGGMDKTGGDMAKSAFIKSATAVVVNQPVATVDEANALVKSVRDDFGADFVQAEGVCFGNPAIKAGGEVNVKEVGKRFSGKYFVTAVTHTFSGGLYETSISVTGRRPNTLYQLMSEDRDDVAEGLVRGMVVGLVTNNTDDEDFGRIKCKFPTLGKDPAGKEIESHWVRIATPMAGQDKKGLYYLPEINDEVLIAFEHGDVNRPYMVGALWNSPDKPPKPNSQVVGNGKVNQRIIQSRTGHVVILDDTANAEQIVVRDKTGKNEVIIDSPSNTMTVNIEKDIKITAKGNINIKATGDITMDCRNMTINTMQNFKVEAKQNVDVIATMNSTYKATMNNTLEGTTMLTAKSGGGAEMTMTGPTIDMNKGALTIT